MLRADEVLYWMVDNPTIVTGGGDRYAAANADSHGPEIAITDARIAAFLTDDAEAYHLNRTGGEGGESFSGPVIYLDMYYQEGNPPHWVVDPTAVPRIDSAFIDNGILTGEGAAAYAMASLGTLEGEDLSKYSFAIELGAWSDPEAVDANWLLAAVSATATYEMLADFRNIEIGVQQQMPWNPGTYSAPEPTSGLLLLIGGALLALKRKRV